MSAPSAPRVMFASTREAPFPRAVGIPHEGVRGSAPPDAWSILRWTGVAILVMGLSQLVPLWIPADVRNPDWVLSSAARTSEAFPALALGLGFLFAAASARARWRPLVALGMCFGALSICVLGSGLVYGATVVGMMHDIAAGDPARLRELRWTAARTGWIHLLSGGFALAAGVAALLQARLYQTRQRV